MGSSCCLCVCVSPINVLMPEPIFMKLGMYIMTLESLSTGVLHKSLPSVCVSIYVSPTIAKQQLAKDGSAATNTHATIE
jgi:hypothetical protein